MQSDANKILPIIGKNSKLKANKGIIFFVAVAIVLILAGALFVILSTEKNSQTQTLPLSEGDKKVNDQQLLSVWGTVTGVKVLEVQTVSGVSNSGVLLSVKADSGKDYEVSVNNNTEISRGRAISEKNTEERLGSRVDYELNKTGDRIYLSSNVDLNSETTVQAENIVNINWFETVVPR